MLPPISFGMDGCTGHVTSASEVVRNATSRLTGLLNLKAERNIAIRRILLPKDTNHRGEVFGGALLAEIDLAGAFEARQHTCHDVATVAVKEVVFKYPVRVGDVVTFYTSLVKLGTTSITVRVEVEASRTGLGSHPVNVTAAEVVYVAIARESDGTIRKIPLRSEVISTVFIPKPFSED